MYFFEQKSYTIKALYLLKYLTSQEKKLSAQNFCHRITKVYLNFDGRHNEKKNIKINKKNFSIE